MLPSLYPMLLAPASGNKAYEFLPATSLPGAGAYAWNDSCIKLNFIMPGFCLASVASYYFIYVSTCFLTAFSGGRKHCNDWFPAMQFEGFCRRYALLQALLKSWVLSSDRNQQCGNMPFAPYSQFGTTIINV